MYKLLKAPPLEGGIAPLNVTFERIQDALQHRHYLTRPIDENFLVPFAAFLEAVFHQVEVDPHFETTDKREWFSIRFLTGAQHRYRILFPRHENCRTTGQVSLFCESLGTPRQKDIEGLATVLTYLFVFFLRDFHWKKG